MDDDFLTRYSNFAKLVRITAYCTRFTTKFKGAILADEYEQSWLRILRIIQQKEFSDEIDDITKGKPLKKRLRSLNPFIDRDGILRVGGRLRNVNVNNDYRHPILLPPSHHVTHLLIREAHERTMHGTVNMVRQYLRMRYWLINDKKSIRHELHRCLTCLKQNSKPATQLMGDYPAVRINPAHPFMHCGVDFAGPFRTRMSKGRSTATLKGYICLFICMVTKAIHLELVSDLSTEAFLAAFKRFISRRGLCKEIYSDHGTNFTGASKYIDQEMAEAIERSSNEIARITAKDGVSFKFIPVATPHFGGLWEAGVKSAKRHIKGVFDECRIVPTFEEFSTILCQIEACLNSRPLVPLSNSPDDLEELTPAHFLVSRPLMALPEVDITNESLHDRWQQLKQINQIFWKRWVYEYLHLLQKRDKRIAESPNLRCGQMVLIREREAPPTKWPLARILEVHPGQDGKVRVVTIRYHGNKCKQIDIVNLCPLPDDIPAEPIPGPSISGKPATTIRKRPPVPRRANNPPKPTSPSTANRNPRRAKKPKIAPCTWAKALLNIAILFFTFATAFTQDTSTEYYKIWKPQAGYYVEKLQPAKIIRGKLRLEVDLPLKNVNQDLDGIASTLNKSQEMCQMTQELLQSTHCDVLLRHLTSKRNELTRQTDELTDMREF
ncbi:uncharacterized protein LOC119648870 [Hermetia illucens]|uniref:uncharacterized protein LOC119648870 n=1 Tax=Hermetia illucens TaxID=343691 RepID=UPI0018CC73EC|nr:uncharacterized protein LOC119648870 [Hermetia illucens]